MKTVIKPVVRNIIIFIALLLADQLLKHWAALNRVFIDLGMLAFNYTTNTGASFGILQQSNALLAWFSLIVLGLIMIHVDKIKKEQSLPVLLITAGLVGNLIDRVFRGHVVDFIDFRFWPVFNLADSLIVVGVVWLAVSILVLDNKKYVKNKDR